MTTAIRPLNIVDLTGGLNLRADAFQLKDNESPEMRNVDVDPRGGVRSRRGWTRWNGTAESTWSPQRLHVWDQPDGSRDVLVVNNGAIRTGASGTLAGLSDAIGAVDPAAAIHGADFADWAEKLYIACGKTKAARSWVGSGNAVKLTASGPTWQDDYTNPTTLYFPSCDYVTTYQGYMVAASTTENSVAYPNRVRFSHPNNPENWASLDYIDIKGGGAYITGIVAFSDHVVVFKTNSVWAIYGNDRDSFTPVNITMAIGAIHRNAIALSDQAAYFYSHPNGVHKYTPGDGIKEVSSSLRPIIDSGELNPAQINKMFMGFLNRRVWWSVPYERAVTATDCRSTFVYDVSLDAWTLYNDANGDGLGPFATGGNQGNNALLLAAHRTLGYLLNVDYRYDALDTIATVDVGFPTLYASRWLHAGFPALPKSWKRPDYVVSEEQSPWTLTVDVMINYDESNPRSTHAITVGIGGGGLWGTGLWGTGTWGGTPRGAHTERGGSIGLAKSLQLRFNGQVGKAWGLNAVVCKFKPRRFK